MNKHRKKLRELMAKPGMIVAPGGGTPLDIRLIEQAGFDVAYMTGYGAACVRYGVPDIGLLGNGELEDTVRAMRQVSDIPLIVDCDTGYGDIANVKRVVQGMESLGVAGIQLEDQVWPKKCGHMEGKFVEPRDVAVRKIKAAVAARTDKDMLIIARTDARGPHGMDEAMVRAKMFMDEGADMIFFDGPKSLDELQQICKANIGPQMANMSETGLTPILSAKELEEIGFKLTIWPSTTSRIAVRQVSDFLKHLKTTGDSRPWLDRMASLSETNTKLGLDDVKAFEKNITG
ncbi:MAG: carboxyvinyl-carboxyphosphonate phosphorylmutase [Alphaproteobacteria bacterium]|jgi:2-methylisocitrate lyase-like PEP mutase family enzyme|nr:carboxyvinyl-carboxyphosphonate phosphorylmutase [Alphaproteobacteria bacterium]PHX99253.1 MAG: carboxyvinyl-carboxyphosphonate phosphorylmutase [Rhodospirillaceae bacterium]